MEVFEEPEPVVDLGVFGDHAAAFVDEVFDVFAECVFSGGDAFHGDDGECCFTDDLHEGPLHTADRFAVIMESRELIGGDVVGGFPCGFSVEEDVGTGGEEFGPADKTEFVCDAIEDLELLVCYVEIDSLSHWCDFMGVPSSVIRHQSSVINHRSMIPDGYDGRPQFFCFRFFQT